MDAPADRRVRTAIVLQGGGALGAYEYGVLKALYEKRDQFQPTVVAGVSIGAITAAVLCGYRQDPLSALERLWTDKLCIAAPQLLTHLPSSLDATFGAFLNPATFSNPGMYRPNAHLLAQPWAVTSYYDAQPLRRTLNDLIDLDRLNSGETRVILTAAEVRTADLRFFDTRSGHLSIEKVVASASLPPGLPMVPIDGEWYWDGGLLSNLPLSPAINALEEEKRQNADVDLELIVVELFPEERDGPRSLPGVTQRMTQLIFASKLALDKKFFKKIDDLVDLLAEIDDALPQESPIRQKQTYQQLAGHRKIKYFTVVQSSLPTELSNATDFSREAIKERIDIGYADAVQHGIDSPR